MLGNNLTGILDGYFVQPSSGNLALTARAIGAIDKAEILPEVPTDIRGRPRVGNADFGAWEFDGAYRSRSRTPRQDRGSGKYAGAW